MILNVYCFFDTVLQNYLPQFLCMPSDAALMRGLKAMVNNPQFPYRDTVEDIKIYKVGVFDVEQGFTSIEKSFVCNLVDFKDVLKTSA